MTNYAALGNAHRDFTLDEAMKREDVKALKDQLDRLETSAWQKRVNEKADQIAKQMREKIKELGEEPCV